MDFSYSEQQEMIKESARDFAKKEISPLIAKMETEKRTAPELIPMMKELGFYGIQYPEEYGGVGCTYLEYVMVLDGEIHVCHGTDLAERIVVGSGQGFVLEKGTRVRWEWPGPCKYVAICLPAFSPDNAGREEATGPVAKTEAALRKLRELHATSASAVVSSFQAWPAAHGAAVGVGAAVGFLLARSMRS